MDTSPVSTRSLRTAAALGALVGLAAVGFAFTHSWWLALIVLYMSPLIPVGFVQLTEMAKR